MFHEISQIKRFGYHTEMLHLISYFMRLISADDKFIQFQTNTIIRQKSSNGRL